MPVFAGTAAADRIVGSADADQIYGLDGNDTLYGMDGNDWLVGGLGNDLLVGGLGDDSYDVDAAGDQVVERAGEGIDYVRASISYQLGANVENLSLTGTADLVGYGNGLDNAITGNAGNNVLNGGAGNDILAGGLGNDVYDVDSTGDKVFERENEGYDRVRATASFALSANIEELNLGGTADINGFGNASANTIIGNAGANVLNGGAGDDILIGRGGNDVYDVDSTGDQVLEAANEGYDRVRASVSYTLGANVEELDLGGTANIDGTGNALDNTIIGNAGVNVLYGGAGDDVLLGGDGNDELLGGAGKDKLIGGGGDDFLEIRPSEIVSGETYDGGAGNDTLFIEFAGLNFLDLRGIYITGIESFSARIDVILYSSQLVPFSSIKTDFEIRIANAGIVDLSHALLVNGTIDLSNLGNTLYLPNQVEGEGFVSIHGGVTADTVIGGSKGENLSGGDGDDRLEGKGGNDLLEGGIGKDSLLGGDGDDILYGNDGNDVLQGGAGADQLTGGAGTDVMIGGAGDDVYDLTFASSAEKDIIVEAAGGGIDTVIASFDYTLGAEIENLTLGPAIGSGGGPLRGIGNALNNIIQGGTYLDGGAGDDTLIGGSSDTTYIVDSAGDVVIQSDNGFPSSTIKASVSYTLPDHVRTLILTGTDNLNATGNELDNSIYGNTGRNVLDGGAGDDVLYISKDGELVAGESYIGGAGHDELFIGDILGTQDLSQVTLSGIEVLSVNFGNILLTSNQFGSFLEVYASGTLTLTDSGVVDLSDAISVNANQIRLSDHGNELILPVDPVYGMFVKGGAGDDIIFAPVSNATIYGNDGDDVLTGGARQDYIDGGSGDDRMAGGAGDDHYEVDSSTDQVIELAGGGTDEVFSSANFTLGANVENLYLTGTGAINAAGNDLANRLYGNDGANIISGGGGNDIIAGGSGADTLTGGTGADIFDLQFGGGDTVMDFNRAEGDKLALWWVGGFTYLGSSAFTAGNSTEARFDGGHLLVDTDGNGTADFAVTIVGINSASQLQSSDFIFSPM